MEAGYWSSGRISKNNRSKRIERYLRTVILEEILLEQRCEGRGILEWTKLGIAKQFKIS